MKVNDIFYSVQGEGRWTGTPAVFVRLAGCNLRCPFCDTNHENGGEMTDEEIVAAVKAYPARVTIITGGEPLLQLTPSLVKALHNAGLRVHIETNGTIDNPAVDAVDWITVSPKGAPLKISRVDELKVLFTGQDLHYYDAVIEHYGHPHLSLQPLDSGDAAKNVANIAATVGAVKADPRWTLSLQTHKLIDIP